MAKGDGEKILIRFTQPLIGDLEGNESKFDISFQEYNYVPGGALQTVHRPVKSVTPYISLTSNINVEDGALNKTSIVEEKITLEDEGLQG